MRHSALMPAVLSISSQVVRGHVGNSASVPALSALGFSAWPVPTVILSNHPAHGATARHVVSSADLEAMVAMLGQFGWLSEVAAVLTGYFADVAQVEWAAELIRTLKRANARLVHCCDPIIGDDPDGLYVPDAVANAIRDIMLPVADILTPNRFELAWLSGRTVEGTGDAATAARSLSPPEVLATSIAAGPDRLATMTITGDDAWSTSTKRRPEVPKGTGDLLTALYLGHRLRPTPMAAAQALAMGGLMAVLDHSKDADELQLAGTQMLLFEAEPASFDRHEDKTQ